MRYIILVLFSFCVAFAQEHQQEVEYSVEKAILYQNSAQVFTQSKVILQPGNNEVHIKGVSQNINSQSIVIGGLKDASVNQIQFMTDYLVVPEKQKELKEVEQKLAKVLLEKSKLTNANAALDTEKDLLQKNQLIASQENNASLEKLKQYASYYRERTESINNQQYDIKLQLEDVIGRQNALQKQKNQLEAQLTENRGVIKVNLFAEEAMTTQLKLNYQIYNAGWNASYELRAEEANQPISFLYQAEVYQHSGSNWDNVDLYLSTGSPRNNMYAPQLPPLFLNFLVERNLQGRVSGVNSESELDEVVVVGYGTAAKSSSSPNRAERIETQASTVFHLGKNQSLVSSPTSSKKTIEKKQVDARFVYETTPSVSNDVFLKAYIKNWEELDLVKGEAKLYLGDTYAGTTQINTSIPEEELSISFGVDESISVERKEVKSNQSKTFFRNQQIVSKNYSIEVHNTKSSAIDIVIKDRIPVAQNSDIKVEDVELNNGELEDHTGLVTWKTKLQPKQKWTTNFSFSVKSPKDKHINFR